MGTHRLLSKDVRFKNLGLWCLTREQRFGVEDKEKLKVIKTGVDVLTMSATPIPRTLHMALTGMRDISTIATPPRERVAVESYVTAQSDALIRDIILREFNRQGAGFSRLQQGGNYRLVRRATQKSSARGQDCRRSRSDERGGSGKQYLQIFPRAFRRSGMLDDY